MIFTPSPQPVAAQLADFHVSDDGVGEKCAAQMKWDRDWVVAPGPVFSLWHSYAFNALLDLLETKCCQNGMFWRKMSYKRLCQFARLYFDSMIER